MLKENYEKIIVCVALTFLTIVPLRLGLKLHKDNLNPVRMFPKGELIEPLDPGPYTNAIAQLMNIPLWTHIYQDPFGITKIEDQEPVVTFPEGSTFFIEKVYREPFKLLFKAYTGDGSNFQLNFRDFRKTFIIRSVGDYVKDAFEDTGYKIISFEKRISEEEGPSIQYPRGKDRSLLTLEHESEKPIVLQLGKQAEQEEPVAQIRCISSQQRMTVRRGFPFTCADKEYNVVDIAHDRMLVVESETKEQITVNVKKPE